MKDFLEEYGKIIIAAIAFMIIVIIFYTLIFKTYDETRKKPLDGYLTYTITKLLSDSI